jgi:arylsulfatase A
MLRIIYFSLVLLMGYAQATVVDRPNVVVIFCDDLGYSDIGPFGAQGYSTPHLDKLAAGGTCYTNFHVAQPVCSASRAALLTGCYPNRIGIHGALSPAAKHGIHGDETTLGEVFRSQGYATAAVGKWHLGHHAQFLPTRHGFDSYLGLPYSNDMWPFHPEAKAGSYPKLPLMQNEQVIDEDVTPEDQEQLTTRYTEAAVKFIQQSKEKPFFLYLAHSMPHVPLYVSSKFKGKSQRGIFGDVIMEIDWSVGQVMQALKDSGVEENTLVIFTSDNGPWLSYGDHAGSAGPLREGKGSSWEGGVRVPCIMSWPGRIPAGARNESMLMTIDLLPTLAGLIGAPKSKQEIDGKDVWPLLKGDAKARNPHDHYFIWYENNQLQAVISADGQWKLQLPHGYRSVAGVPRATGGKPSRYEQVKITSPQLYHLSQDQGESTDVAKDYPAELAKLQAAADTARAQLGDSLSKQQGSATREPGRLE